MCTSSIFLFSPAEWTYTGRRPFANTFVIVSFNAHSRRHTPLANRVHRGRDCNGDPPSLRGRCRRHSCCRLRAPIRSPTWRPSCRLFAAALAARLNRLANGLLGLRIRPGDRQRQRPLSRQAQSNSSLRDFESQRSQRKPGGRLDRLHRCQRERRPMSAGARRSSTRCQRRRRRHKRHASKGIASPTRDVHYRDRRAARGLTPALVGMGPNGHCNRSAWHNGRPRRPLRCTCGSTSQSGRRPQRALASRHRWGATRRGQSARGRRNRSARGQPKSSDPRSGTERGHHTSSHLRSSSMGGDHPCRRRCTSSEGGRHDAGRNRPSSARGKRQHTCTTRQLCMSRKRRPGSTDSGRGRRMLKVRRPFGRTTRRGPLQLRLSAWHACQHRGGFRHHDCGGLWLGKR